MHDADTMQKLLLAAMTQPAPPLASVFPGVPPELAALVDTALAFKQEHRFQDARNMQAAVRTVRERMMAGAASLPDTRMPSLAGAAPMQPAPIQPAGTQVVAAGRSAPGSFVQSVPQHVPQASTRLSGPVPLSPQPATMASPAVGAISGYGPPGHGLGTLTPATTRSHATASGSAKSGAGIVVGLVALLGLGGLGGFFLWSQSSRTGAAARGDAGEEAAARPTSDAASPGAASASETSATATTGAAPSATPSTSAARSASAAPSIASPARSSAPPTVKTSPVNTAKKPPGTDDKYGL